MKESSEDVNNIEEQREDTYEECNSTDEEELIRAFAPSISWLDTEEDDAVAQHRNNIIMQGNLSPRSRSNRIGKQKQLLDLSQEQN